MSISPPDYNNWMVALTSDPPAINFDVKFEFVNKQGEVQGEILGHKMLLALASPVFRAEFYGADFTEKKSETIEKEDASKKPFENMMNFIYKKPTSFENMPVEEIFDTYVMAHFYNISELEELSKQKLATFKMTKDTVVDVASVAQEFKKYEEASTALFNNCVDVLSKELETKESVLSFCSELSDSGEEARAIGLKLLSAVKKLPSAVKKLPCPNCQLSPCQSGSLITSIDQIRVGTKVAPNPNSDMEFVTNPDYSGSWSNRGETEIVSVGVDTLKVATGPSGSYPYLKDHNYSIILGGQSLFCFICKT